MYTTDSDGYECDTNGRPAEWNKPDNDYVENGNMVLKASYSRTTDKKNSDGSYYNRFIGSDIDTVDYFKYGYFEIRAKMNLVEGTMSAFWLCGNRTDGIEYELDIFECHGKYPGLFKQTALAHPYENGSDKKSGATYNFAYNVTDELADVNSWNNATNLSARYKTQQLKSWYEAGYLGTAYTPDHKKSLETSSYFQVADLTDWHTYGLDWREDSIIWYIDGIATMRLVIPEGGLQVTDNGNVDRIYKFDKPMRLILGLGVDSSGETPWSIVPDGQYDTVNQASMTIDYVRVYQDSKGEVYKNYESTK